MLPTGRCCLSITSSSASMGSPFWIRLVKLPLNRCIELPGQADHIVGDIFVVIEQSELEVLLLELCFEVLVQDDLHLFVEVPLGG